MSSLLLLAASLAAARARVLSDTEITHFYGYSYMEAPTRPMPVPLDATQSLKAAAAAAGIYIVNE